LRSILNSDRFDPNCHVVVRAGGVKGRDALLFRNPNVFRVLRDTGAVLGGRGPGDSAVRNR
jgi:hypothetical protein